MLLAGSGDPRPAVRISLAKEARLLDRKLYHHPTGRRSKYQRSLGIVRPALASNYSGKIAEEHMPNRLKRRSFLKGANATIALPMLKTMTP